jgi:hypothetical protein
MNNLLIDKVSSGILKPVIDGLGLSTNEFERQIGVSYSSIATAIRRGTAIKSETSKRILKTFPQINPKYLETGIGSMFINEQTPSKSIPVLGDAVAGTNQQLIYNDTRHEQSERIDVGDLLRDSEAAFTVFGNSMVPSYPSGCLLGIRRNYDGFIQPGETYVIVTKSNRVFKRLYNTDDLGAYECFSDNVMVHESGALKGKYFYPPFKIPKDDVIEIWDVVGMIRRNRNSMILNRM